MTAGATPVFETEDSVFFVGGRGTKAGDADAGGCLKSYWDANEDLSLIMGANGNVLSAGDAWGGCMTACSITLAADACHILITKASAFPSPIAAGLVAHCKFHALSPYVGDDGRYEILSVPDANSIVVDIVHVGDDADHCDVKVGGAFSTLQGASDNTDANTATPQNVFILTNKPETIGAALDIDVGGGDLTEGTWKRIIGIDDDGSELPAGDWVTIDADGLAGDCVSVQDLGNVELRHIHAYNTSGNYAGFNFFGSSNHLGFILTECKATVHGYGVVVQGLTIRNFSIIGGIYSASSRAFWIKGVLGGSIQGAYGYSEGDYVFYSSSYGMQLQGCLFESDGTGSGVCVYGAHFSVIRNCVFYNVIHGISITHSNSTLAEYNNIFVVSAKATGKAINRISGGIAYSDYGCLWALDGAPEASGRWGGDGIPDNAIEQDPQFVDAASGDFRLQSILAGDPNNSPCLNIGRPLLGKV